MSLPADFNVWPAAGFVLHDMPWKCINWEINTRTGVFCLLEVDDLISSMMYKSDDGSWACSSCSYVSKRITSVKEHVESKHIAPQQYICHVCNYSCPTRKALKMHIFRNKHWTNFPALNDLIKSKMFRSEDGTFGCCECDYSTKYNTTMQNHIESKHLSTSGFHCSYCQKFCPTRKGWICWGLD